MEIIYGNYLLREKSKVARIFVARGSKFCAQRAARNDFRSTQTGLSKDLACVGRPEVRDGSQFGRMGTRLGPHRPSRR